MVKKTNTTAIAAAQVAGRNGANDWEPGGISNSDHRLRSLMNFERDVVQSSYDDAEALPQWSAFLRAYDKAAGSRDSAAANGAPAIQNLGFRQDSAIAMDKERANRFVDVMRRVTRNVQSLNAAGASFPQNDLRDGEMDAATTVSAFCRQILDDISLAYGFIENEEPAQLEVEGDAR